MASAVVGLEQIKAAAARIVGCVHKTEVNIIRMMLMMLRVLRMIQTIMEMMTRRKMAMILDLYKVLTCSTLDTMTGKQLFFKAEMFQKTGSFKVDARYISSLLLIMIMNRREGH